MHMTPGLTVSSSARLALIGLTYVYIVKFIDTLWHGIFSNTAISFTVVILNILAGSAQLSFFYLVKSKTSKNGIFHDIAGWAGVIGALITIVPKLLALSVLLQFHFSFNPAPNSQLIAVLSPCVGAVMLFVSCVIFFLLGTTIGNSRPRVFLYGTIGYLTLAVPLSMLVLDHYSGGQVEWQHGEVGTNLMFFIISASFSFLCIAYFYSGFLGCKES